MFFDGIFEDKEDAEKEFEKQKERCNFEGYEIEESTNCFNEKIVEWTKEGELNSHSIILKEMKLKMKNHEQKMEA